MSELDALVNERSAAYREKYSYENQLMAVGDKIQRLRYAVKQVDGVKDGLVAMSTRTINLATVENWKGNKFTEYQAEISELSAAILSYGLEVDRIHDDMNLELARLQNEESNLQGLSIKRQIVSVGRSLIDGNRKCRISSGWFIRPFKRREEKNHDYFEGDRHEVGWRECVF